MTREARKVRRTEESSGRWSWATLAEIGKGVATPILAAMAGAFAFWFEPARDRIQHWIWDENAALELSVYPSELRAGDEAEIVVIGRPSGHIGVGQGLLRLQIPSEFQLVSGAPVVPVSAFKEPLRIQGEKPIIAWAVKEGRVEVGATLETLNGKYESRSAVTILPPSSTGRATRKNFSGRWSASIGTDLGYFSLVEKPPHRSFIGEYRIGIESGALEGHRDGVTFQAILFRGNSPARWFLDGNISNESADGSLEIVGNATLQEFQNGKWRAVEAPSPFKATAG